MLVKSVGLSLFLSVMALQASSSEYGPEVNKKAPDFALDDSKGNTYQLSDYQGNKAVVIEFFRSGGW